MECIETKNFERLIKISKVLFPVLLIFSFIFYQFYRYSIDTIEITVISKDLTWLESCSEYECVELPVFTIRSTEESFNTTEDLFNQVEENNKYLVGTKGWRSFGASRKLTQVY